MRVKVGGSGRWFFVLLFGGGFGAFVLYLLVGSFVEQPGRPVGVYLVALGVALVVAALIPALRVREQLRTGALAQGIVVGAEERRTGSQEASKPSRYYHPRVQFSTPTAVRWCSRRRTALQPSPTWDMPSRSVIPLIIPAKPR
jgi:hypothetical protein